jgi:spore coat protein H
MIRPPLLAAVALLTLCFVQSGYCGAKGGPELFGLTNLWVIHLTLEGGHWASMESADQRRPGVGRLEGPDRPGMPPPLRPGNAGPPRPGPGMFQRDFPWTTCTFQCADQTLTNVAIRFKGNSSFMMSRETLKRPFKLRFDRGAKGRRFMGVKELSLNNNFNDSTQFREVLGYDACRQAGLPTPRTAFARIYLTISGQLTNQLLGLYTLVEAVDGDFLKAHFGAKQGLLLKPERLPSLEYLGENWNAYTNRYQPKTQAELADQQRFISLTRLISRGDEATLERELPTRIDMENFLRYLAVNALLANYDSFMGNGHNYYLFQPAKGAKATFIPWDLNEAFGGHPPLGPRLHQVELTVLRPQAGLNRLIDRVLANPAWAAEYRKELSNLLTNSCAPARLQSTAAQLADVTRETVFAESPLARALFQRVALGQSEVPIPAESSNRGRFSRFDRQEPSVSDWISVRMRNATDELAGKRQGVPTRLPR